MKKRIIIGGVILVVAAALVFWYVSSSKKPAVSTLKATKGDIARNVLVTGTTKPMQSVDLSFEQVGKVSAVYVNVGDKVKAGQPLVELEKSGLLAQLAQANAGVASAQAQLDQLKSGTRPEQIAVQEVTVANAQVSVNRAQQALFDALNDAYAKADDASRTKTDENFTNPRSPTPTLNFRSINSQYDVDLPNKKFLVERTLIEWKTSLDSLAVGSGLLAAANDAQKRLKIIGDYLDELAAALNYVIPDYAVNAAAWKVNVATARTQVNTAVSALAAADTGLRGTQATLDLAQKNLDLARAGSTPEQIASQQAVVDQAKAGIQSIQVQLGKTVLRSPIDGVVTVQGAKLGQIVTVTTSAIANSSLISIISLKQMEVDANIPEVDIGRLKLGQEVGITFDALPGELFKGSVMTIDPAETVIDGVVNYKIKIALESSDPRIKSGLTANLVIQTEVKKGVILLPQNAILQNETGTFVRVPDGKGGFNDVPVKLGIRGNDGNVELISGVNEGDTVANVGLK